MEVVGRELTGRRRNGAKVVVTFLALVAFRIHMRLARFFLGIKAI